MLTAVVKAFDNSFILLAGLAGQEIIINGFVGDTHLVLVRLPVKETGGRRFVNNRAGCIQVCQELIKNGKGATTVVAAPLPFS